MIAVAGIIRTRVICVSMSSGTSRLIAGPARLARYSYTVGEGAPEVMVEAARSAATTPDPSLRPLLQSLRDGDASLQVREAARIALERPASPPVGGAP